MTARDELLAMAEQAGISISYHGSTGNPTISINADASALERLVALAVAPYKDDAERHRYAREKGGFVMTWVDGQLAGERVKGASYDEAIDNARSAK